MTDIDIPPTPATVGEAKRQANDLAYGFEKHTGDYWNDLYRQDPDYAWKRMLGWQAGGADVARFGLWANPPSPWHGAAEPPQLPTPNSIPVPDNSSRFDALEAQIADLKGLILTIAQRPAPDYETHLPIHAYVASLDIVLKPKVSP